MPVRSSPCAVLLLCHVLSRLIAARRVSLGPAERAFLGPAQGALLGSFWCQLASIGGPLGVGQGVLLRASGFHPRTSPKPWFQTKPRPKMDSAFPSGFFSNQTLPRHRTFPLTPFLSVTATLRVLSHQRTPPPPQSDVAYTATRRTKSCMENRS